jgi:dUTP pyrophosphatase
MINLSNEAQIIEDGDRIAQMIIATYEVIDWELSETLDDTDRGSGGFGHTGKK